MATEVVGVQIKVDSSQATQSLGSVRKEIKQANSDLLAAQKQFGDYSAEALAAAKKVAQLKDSIQEARETADLFDPGKKFQVFAGAASALAGGFTAVQGALGLVGVKSDEVEKSILKVQSALALSQGLSSVADSAKDFQRLAAVVKTQVVTAFSTLRGAIIATGVGALAVGLGLVIANFDAVKKAVLNLFPGLGKLADFLGGIVQKFTDFVGITSEADRQLAAFEKTNKRVNEDIDAKIKLLTAQGSKEKEIFALQKQANQNEANSLRERLKLTGQLTEEEQKRFRELKVESAVLDASEQKRIADLNTKRAEQSKAEKEKLDKEKKDREEQRREDFIKYVKDLEEDTNAEIELQNFLIENQKKKDQELFEWRVEIAQRTYDITEDTYEFYQELAKKQKDEEQAILDARLAGQLGYANAVGDVFGQLAGLFEQGTAAAKVAALAEIAIGTGTGFINALNIAQKGANATGPAAPFAFPIFYATQLAAVLGAASKAKNILSTVKGGGGVGGGASAPRIGTNAPISPQIPQSSFTELGQNSINQLGSATNRAYVVESDVTNSQERVTRINRAARLA
jgi:hypothetical protein